MKTCEVAWRKSTADGVRTRLHLREVKGIEGRGNVRVTATSDLLCLVTRRCHLALIFKFISFKFACLNLIIIWSLVINHFTRSLLLFVVSTKLQACSSLLAEIRSHLLSSTCPFLRQSPLCLVPVGYQFDVRKLLLKPRQNSIILTVRCSSPLMNILLADGFRGVSWRQTRLLSFECVPTLSK